MRVKLILSYDGTAYCGWQIQPNGITVQQTIEEAVRKVTGEKVRVTGSGRTDSGVHALRQVAHFDTESTVPPEKFYRALNAFLPSDVKALKSEAAPEGFNACTSAKKKTYAYNLYVSEVELPLKERFSMRLDKRPDIEKMKKAAEIFVGRHDFKCFNASGGGARNTVRTVYGIEIVERGENISVSVTGNGFLYNMVRILVGTLLSAGYGETDCERLKRMLESGERALGGKTLPAKGLCLMNVEYV